MSPTDNIVSFQNTSATAEAQNTRILEAAQIVEDLAYEMAGNLRPDQTGQLIDFAREMMALSLEVQKS